MRTVPVSLAHAFSAMLLLLYAGTGCGPDALAPDPAAAPHGAAFKRVGGEPAYSLVVLDSLPGQNAAYLADMNDAHEAVGRVVFPREPGIYDAVAIVWSAGSGGLQPTLLPHLTGQVASSALGISPSGLVAGASGPSATRLGAINEAVPVIWYREGGEWLVRALEGRGSANDINQAGEAAGTGVVDGSSLSRAMLWYADGNVVPLPLAERFTHGSRAAGLNDQGDVAGASSEPFPGGSLIWAAVWVRTDHREWQQVILSGGEALTVMNRAADGRLIVAGMASDGDGCCKAVRWTVTRDPITGVWLESARTVLATYGSARGSNYSGDLAGAVRKSSWATASEPALFPATGGTIKLPTNRLGAGEAAAVTSDRWLVGHLGGRAVLWRLGS